MARIRTKMLPDIPSEKLTLSQLDWAPQTDYTLDVAITYQNNLYVCTLGHTSSDTFDETKFKLLSKGVNVGGQSRMVSDHVVVAENTIVDIPVSSPNIVEPYVLKQTGTMTWEKAYEDRTYLQEADYKVSLDEALTIMTITFLSVGTYKIFV